MTLIDLGYELLPCSESDNMVYYIKGNKHENISINFRRCYSNHWIVSAIHDYFQRNERVMAPQDAEDDWISHSAKYGMHIRESAKLTIDELEAIANELRRLMSI